MLFYSAASREVTSMLGCGRSPQSLTLEVKIKLPSIPLSASYPIHPSTTFCWIYHAEELHVLCKLGEIFAGINFPSRT